VENLLKNTLRNIIFVSSYNDTQVSTHLSTYIINLFDLILKVVPQPVGQKILAFSKTVWLITAIEIVTIPKNRLVQRIWE
jgi:hypothetical protein